MVHAPRIENPVNTPATAQTTAAEPGRSRIRPHAPTQVSEVTSTRYKAGNGHTGCIEPTSCKTRIEMREQTAAAHSAKYRSGFPRVGIESVTGSPRSVLIAATTRSSAV